MAGRGRASLVFTVGASESGLEWAVQGWTDVQVRALARSMRVPAAFGRSLKSGSHRHLSRFKRRLRRKASTHLPTQTKASPDSPGREADCRAKVGLRQDVGEDVFIYRAFAAALSFSRGSERLPLFADTPTPTLKPRRAQPRRTSPYR